MKTLILEDDAERMKSFAKKFRNSEVYHVEHAKDAIKLLKKSIFDLICLDHDLGGTQMNYDPNDCGYNVAEYLEQYPVKAKIIIHSFNVPAANRMMSILPQAEYIPGYWLENESGLIVGKGEDNK